MGRKPIVAQPKPLKLSEWAKQAGRPVTRGEVLNVIYIFIERRFLVEREIQRGRKWRVRFWIWFTSFFTGQREPSEQEVARAVEKVFDTKAGVPEPEAEEEEQEDGAEEGGRAVIESPPEIIGEGVKYRDKRKRGPEQAEDSPVTDSEGDE